MNDTTGGANRLRALVAGVAALLLLAGVATVVLTESSRETDPATSGDDSDIADSPGTATPTPAAAKDAASESPRAIKQARAAQRRARDRAALDRARRLGCRGNRYEIGYQGPLSGDFAELGQHMLNGVTLALSQAGRGTLPLPGGKRLPSKIKLVAREIDSKGSGESAKRPAEKAASRRTLLAVVGPAFSGEVTVAGPIYDDAGIPFVSPTATSPLLPTFGWNHFFRTLGDDDAQAKAIAKFMATDTGLASGRVAVVGDGSDYGEAMAEGVSTALKDRGIRTVVRMSVAPERSSYRDDARRIVKARPDAVFFGGYFDTAGVLRRDLVRAGTDRIKFVVGDGSFDFGFQERAGSAAAGAYAFFPGTESSEVDQSFVAAYNNRHGEPPGAFAFESYVNATLLVDAIATAGCRREAIRDHIANFDGTIAGKKVAFRKNGETVNPMFTVYRASSTAWFFDGQVR